MGLLHRLLERLGLGSSERPSEGRTDRAEPGEFAGGDERWSPGSISDDSATEGDDGGQGSAMDEALSVDRGAAVEELLDVLEDPPRGVAPEIAGELIDRAEADPGAFEGRIPAMMDRIGADESFPDWVVATPLATLAATAPDRILPHTERLIDLLGESERADEHLGTALATLARQRSVPVEGLLETLESGSPSGTREAAIVLAVIAGGRPSELPIDRLESHYREGDDVDSGGAGYVLAVLAGERPDDVTVLQPTIDSVVDVALAAEAADLQWVSNSLSKDAIPVVAKEATGVEFERFDVATTPMGTQIVFVPAGEAIDDVRETTREITTALEKRLDMDNPQVDVRL